MKKKIISLSIMSAVALCAVGAVFAFGKIEPIYELSGDDDYLSISFNGSDVLEGDVEDEVSVTYKSKDVILKTDQNKNDVKFHYDNCGCYEFGGNYYLEEKGETGSIYNVTEIRSITSLTARINGTFKIEWGFEKDGDDIVYEKSATFSGGSQTVSCYFDYSKPNYFKITNTEGTDRQLTNFVIKMDKDCVHGTSPYASKNGLAFRKYASYAKCIGFAGASTATVVIPDEVDGLPVTRIGENAFAEKTGITSLTLPSGLTNIEDGAFDGCSGITSLVIPNTVVSINFVAFRGLTSCANLTFEAGGTSTLSLGQACFKSLGHEGTLTLPSRISSLANSTFGNVTKVSAYALNSDNVSGNKVSVVDGVLFSTEWGDKYLEAYPCADARTSYTVPSDVTKVRYGAGLSYAKKLVTLNLSPGSSGIYFDGYSAENMTSLENLNFGGTGNITFYWYCLRSAPALKDIYVTSNVVVQSAGFGNICSDSSDPLTVHIPDATKPSSWDSNWDGGGVASGYIVADYGYTA